MDCKPVFYRDTYNKNGGGALLQKIEAVNPHWILCQMHFISEKIRKLKIFPFNKAPFPTHSQRKKSTKEGRGWAIKVSCDDDFSSGNHWKIHTNAAQVLGITTSEYFLVFCPLSSQMIPQEMNLDCLQISQNKTTAKGGAMVRSLIPFIPPFFFGGWARVFGGIKNINQISWCNCRNVQ